MKQLFYSAAFLILVAYAGNEINNTPSTQAEPVIEQQTGVATTWQNNPASDEGTTNIEIRPQVSGYIEKIYVEEGAYVQAGQPIFKINSIKKQ